MPLADGTNDEKEDPQPPLNWTRKEDLTNVVLHNMAVSPPCVKIRTYLKYYQVPFEIVNGAKKDSDYKKIPVLIAGGRQVNDSYIILKNLVPALTGRPVDQAWEDKITYSLQPSIEAEAFMDGNDFATFVKAFMGIPRCIGGCLAFKGRSIANSIRERNPGLPPSVQIGRELAQLVGDKKFAGGDKPNSVDISYFGTIYGFVHLKTTAGLSHVRESGLSEWWDRMVAEMPKDLLE